jgi:hypothetical protein
MYLIFENNSLGVVKQVKDITPQQMQALIDTEEYTIVQISGEAGDSSSRVKFEAHLVMEDLTMEAVMGGTIMQDSSIVQVR